MSEGSPLQDGIYFRPADRPPGRCFRLVLFNIRAGAALGDVGPGLAQMWALLRDLRTGKIADLDPTPPDEAEKARKAKLTCLLGFGARFFRRYRDVHPPRGVVPLGELTLPALPWVADAQRQNGEADVVVQLIADTDLAVDRALVELWMLLARAGGFPLELVTYYSGFNRDDRRSWLGFHDGISNIEPELRRKVIEVEVKDPPWMLGGTYMGFMRLAIDLAAWRERPRKEQEILVGRDKLTGCPVTGVDANGDPLRLAHCPMGANGPTSANYIEPLAPPVAEALVRQSHIHRTNPNRRGVEEQSNRIFRQGYEFVEPLPNGQIRIGLNFVSFQSELERLTHILTLFSWLGDSNFGGVANGAARALSFISLVGGGFYAVPPKHDAFPGADMF
jgi:deferrochelatase/peroxidase EfeB